MAKKAPSARCPASSWPAITSRSVAPISRATWNIDSAWRMSGDRSEGRFERSCSSEITACVVARLPEVMIVIERSPGVSKVNILRKVEMLSTPELVRVSDMKTIPRLS